MRLQNILKVLRSVPISVEDNSMEQTKTRLETEIAIWKDGDDLVVTSALETFHVPR